MKNGIHCSIHTTGFSCLLPSTSAMLPHKEFHGARFHKALGNAAPLLKQEGKSGNLPYDLGSTSCEANTLRFLSITPSFIIKKRSITFTHTFLMM